MPTDERVNDLIHDNALGTSVASIRRSRLLVREVEAEVRAEAQEPVMWQRRMRPSWADWNPWQDCAKETHDECKSVPVVGDWSYEARALYTAPQPPAKQEAQVPTISEMKIVSDPTVPEGKFKIVAPIPHVLIPQPPAPCQHATDTEYYRAECEKLQAKVAEQSGLIARIKQEAQVHAQESRTANSTIAEIYQAISGATGEPGNWHGAAPVREYIAQQAVRISGLEETRDALWETQKALCNQINDRDKLIEMYGSALRSAVEWGAPMKDAPRSSRPEWFDKANSALAALAAHKKGGAS